MILQEIFQFDLSIAYGGDIVGINYQKKYVACVCIIFLLFGFNIFKEI